ncbi:hypothetical protein CYMTET_38617 [Cymbomonas tetramitiformis]|uniref:Uncharacterized protein n=1 Tax=Cymbomonas tetramitiformis TaxID=36881 RepID=A0AAE0CD70_9CHLO|nr:hypothetical protein CYMTET_38617 [Cymbomonas tetramitiformis]
MNFRGNPLGLLWCIDGGRRTATVTFGGRRTVTVTFGGRRTVTVTFGGRYTVTVTFGGRHIVTVTFGGRYTVTVTFGGRHIVTVTFGGRYTVTATFDGFHRLKRIRNRRNSTSGARLRFRAKLGSETALGAALVDTNMLPMYGGAPPGEKTLHRPVAREWTTRGMAELAARIQASLPIASARAPQEDTFDSDSDSGSSSSDDNGRTTALEDVVTIAIKAIA